MPKKRLEDEIMEVALKLTRALFLVPDTFRD